MYYSNCYTFYFLNILSTPYWILWFLFALIFWETISSYLNNTYKTIILTIALSLLAGMNNNVGYYLSISRIIYFLPFFIMGYCFDDKYISILKSRHLQIILAVLMIICICLVQFKIDIIKFVLSSLIFQ